MNIITSRVRCWTLGAGLVAWLAVMSIDQTHAQAVETQTRFALEEAILQASEPAEPLLPGSNERMAVTELFRRTITLASSDPRNSKFRSSLDTLRSDWTVWQMDLVSLRLLQGEEIWLVQEQTAARRGRGIYAVRLQAVNPIILQSPHSRYDRHTRRIVARLFAESRSQASAWSTVHRERIDLAHAEGTYFQAFTLSAATAVTDATVVQIHGFDERKRKTIAASEAALIVSNGTDFPDRWFRMAGQHLADRFPELSVRIYPFDVNELGATTNVQARLLRGVRGSRFLHLEYNRFQRRRLMEDESLRAKLLLALSETSRMKRRDTLPTPFFDRLPDARTMSESDFRGSNDSSYNDQKRRHGGSCQRHAGSSCSDYHGSFGSNSHAGGG